MDYTCQFPDEGTDCRGSCSDRKINEDGTLVWKINGDVQVNGKMERQPSVTFWTTNSATA